jgi:hypothetical protein
MAQRLDVLVFISVDARRIRVNLLDGAPPDATFAMTTLPVSDAKLVIQVWWLTKPTDKAIEQVVYQHVLEYLHELMLEKSRRNAGLKPISDGLAVALMRLLHADEE